MKDVQSLRDPTQFSIDGDDIPTMSKTSTKEKPAIKQVPHDQKDIEFQILDWRSYQEEDYNGKKNFLLRLFGKTRDNKSIQVQVDKFRPYFFVEIDKCLRQKQIDSLLSTVKNKVYPKEYSDDLLSCQVVNKYKFWGFTNYEKFNFLQLTFQNYDAMKAYERVFKKPLKIREISYKDTLFRLYESNIEPFLRCMHIRGLEAVGWAKVDAGKYSIEDDDLTHCDINIKTDWTNLNKVDDRTISPFTIASFDIECTSSDGTFPQANRDGDKIIQIGTTFSKLGEEECYYQHIITLGSCDPLPGVVVESYDSEQEVLLAWTRLLQRTNPDIITGYNIVGFDLEYMKDRSKKLGIYEKFCKLSRMRGESTPFKETKLASSALGDNILKYFDMTGRVTVDLMKVVQRDHKLESYKLDFVASNFINGKIKKMDVKMVLSDNNDGTDFQSESETLIESENTLGLKEGQYITIYYNDGITNNKHMDGKKFNIIKLSEKTILLKGLVDVSIMNKGYKVSWCQAKDDILPRDIFRLQEGTSKDRNVIAKYCIQDCVLCNRLIAKLQVLINNIGMANVCHVPLSYLFMRGQGVKIFSLVAKKCREKQHLIPAIFKKYKTAEEKEEAELEEKKFERFIARLNNGDDEVDDEEDGSYGGALVIEPITGVHYEPVDVLDFASLYPKSMIEKNLSHECIVMDDKQFGALPKYKYHVISYTTGTIKHTYDRITLKNILQSFKKDPKKYIIKDISPNEKDIKKHYQIYDKDHNGKERWLVCDVQTTNTEIIITNHETSKFAEKEDGSKGILPEILTELLDARSKYKKEKDKETDQFKKSVVDGLQMAYKVTANSLYGQTGAPTSAICMKQIAASTTATGRHQLMFSKNFVEKIYGKMINLALSDEGKFLAYCEEIFAGAPDKKFYKPNVKNPSEGWSTRQEFQEMFFVKMNKLLEGKTVDPIVIYGDTDSVFFKMNIKDNLTGEIGRDRQALATSIQLGIWASNVICTLLPDPQEQVYEKVMWPLMLVSKKRYVGNLYETDPNKFYQKSMGIVLKRRDNAQIVKIVCGGIIDYILNKHDPAGAVEFTKKALRDILSARYPMDKFVITKTLKGNGLTSEEAIKENSKPKDQRIYKERSRITHAVLADRMAQRDPGNKPLSNDRIPYVYVIVDHEVELQGERVENPEYVIANNLKLDYLFYITNQIQKPAVQFLELIIKNPGAIFKEYIMRENNRREGKKPIASYFRNDGSDSDFHDIENMLENESPINQSPIVKKRKILKKKDKNELVVVCTSETFTISI